MRAKELMLPRQNKNAIRVMINNDDDEEDIALKREEAQREYGLMKTPKEDLTRKNSSNGGKMQSKTEQKSVSVNKNQMGGNLGSNNNRQPNNMVNPPALLNNKGQHLATGSKRMGMEAYEGGNNNNRDVPPGLNRYNSSQYG